MVRPPVKRIPNRDASENDHETVDEGVAEYGVGDNLVATRILRGNSDQFRKDVAECPLHARRSRTIRVFAAMEQFIQIVRLVGDQRADDITADRQKHRDEIDLVGIDREFHAIHRPLDPRIKRTGHGSQESIHAVVPSMRFNKRTNGLRPVPLADETDQACPRTEDDRAPCSGQISPSAV